MTATTLLPAPLYGAARESANLIGMRQYLDPMERNSDPAKVVKLYTEKNRPWLGLVALVLARFPWRTALTVAGIYWLNH